MSFLPRLFHPVSRPLQWIARSKAFTLYLSNFDIANSYFGLPVWGKDLLPQHYTAVTLMFLCGSALGIFYAIQPHLIGFSGQANLSTEIFLCILPLATLISIINVICFVLLKKIIDIKAAFFSAFFLALDPFHIANSKVVHVDALVSSFMILSVILMAVYLIKESKSWLILSALCGGLAFLTKPPAFALIPFSLLVLFFDAIKHQKENKLCYKLFSKFIKPFIIWLLVSLFVFFIFFPMMWLDPLLVIKNLFQGYAIVLPASGGGFTLSFNNIFHWLKSLALKYYIKRLFIKTTFLSLPLFILGLISLFFKNNDKNTALFIKSLLLYFLVVLFFISLASSKVGMRHMLPLVTALDIIAGLGLFALAKFKGLRIFIPLILLLQCLRVFSHHPYYGTHFNILSGGAAKAQYLDTVQDQAEGLDIIADYIKANNKIAVPKIASRYNTLLKGYLQGMDADYKDIQD
ncbi:MAG: glycosyltransferase family 39 protein, partial [Candidatus Omnitrophica bacterium]|nr:glycosyltransferase family 39 protein [Candidatus Omnitrophota bacterium]